MINPKHFVLGVDFLVGDLMEAPPVCPEGFERSQDNEYVLLKKLPNCSVRDKRIVERTCCGKTERIHCKSKEHLVTRKDCLLCDNPGQGGD